MVKRGEIKPARNKYFPKGKLPIAGAWGWGLSTCDGVAYRGGNLRCDESVF